MNCNCQRGCGKCPSRKCDYPCACPSLFLGIEQLPDALSVLRFNIGGKRADYDFSNLIYQTQSDTVLVADAINRLLKYTAERHTDTITAQELGVILHLADLGDVNTSGASNGSLLVYQKDSNCAGGCVGVMDSWKVWNALDASAANLSYLMGFNSQGDTQALAPPMNPGQYYQLGWNAQNRLSYSQLPTVPNAPVNANGKKLAVYMDPNSKQLVVVEES